MIVRVLSRFATPLVLSQISASLAGAAIMIGGAVLLDLSGLSALGVLTLAQGLLVGAARAILFQPALLTGRPSGDIGTKPRYAFLAAAIGAIVYGVVVSVTLPGQWKESVLILAIAPAMLLQDWIRHNLIGLGKLRSVAASDAIRLTGTIVGLLLLVATQSLTPSAFIIVSLVSYAAALLPSIIHRDWVARSQPFRKYRSTAMSQLAEFGIAQGITAIPMMTLGLMGTSTLIGPMRLAQTVLGPLNMAFSAVSADLLRYASQGRNAAVDREIVNRGSGIAKRLGIASAGFVILLSMTVILSEIELGDVRSGPLALSIALVGAIAFTSGFSGVHLLVMRMLLKQKIVTFSRLVVVICAGMGYAIGAMLFGIDGALIGGFTAAAVAFPFAAYIPARAIYRRLGK